MKYLLLLPLFLISTAFTGGIFIYDSDLGEKSPESQPDYYITSVKPVPTLPAGSAFVMFTFYTERVVPNDTILMSCNGKQEKIVTSKDGQFAFQTTAGKAKFQFFLDDTRLEVYTDSIDLKEQHRTDIGVYFVSSRIPVICEKPVIYFYPQTTTDVSVQLNVNGKLGFTYPLYNNGWNFTADPNGTLSMNNRKYDYLFWDGETSLTASGATLTQGSIVERDSLPSFFEEKLSAMGLNPRERQDFITYWCPRMQHNEKSFVHFMFTSEYDSIATISITPKPDNIFRVFMMWSDGNSMDPASVQEQKIESFNRTGFTVVEWGGGSFECQHPLSSGQTWSQPCRDAR